MTEPPPQQGDTVFDKTQLDNLLAESQKPDLQLDDKDRIIDLFLKINTNLNSINDEIQQLDLIKTRLQDKIRLESGKLARCNVGS